jgi:hypothetical protein
MPSVDTVACVMLNVFLLEQAGPSASLAVRKPGTLWCYQLGSLRSDRDMGQTLGGLLGTSWRVIPLFSP